MSDLIPPTALDDVLNSAANSAPNSVAKRLSTEQQLAVTVATDLSVRIMGITGGAGTGKTTVLKTIYLELCKSHSVVLCAPTGRAAKRISELTGIPAVTIHRLLQFSAPGEDILDEDGNKIEAEPGEPRRCRHYPLDQRIVIVDESSMIGPTLYDQLMDALRSNGCIRFIGDNQQLPPVEKGTPPFVNILTNYPSVTLSFNYRSEDEIVSNAQRILHGSIPTRNSRFEIIYTTDVLRETLRLVDASFAGPNHQIIMATRKGNYGTNRLNVGLQAKLNKNSAMLLLPRQDEREAALVVRPSDKFIWIKNDYGLKMFNGEIGTIDSLNPEDGSLELALDGRDLVHVPAQIKGFNSYLHSFIRYDPRKQLELGYAITTHKSQGSEFDTIIYAIPAGAAFMLNRRNFYTAVTRARHRVIVICERRAMALSLRTYKERDD